MRKITLFWERMKSSNQLKTIKPYTDDNGNKTTLLLQVLRHYFTALESTSHLSILRKAYY